ncbi:MAG TPA: hypothetical protein VFC78_08290, partial [Tepidisphaeraceae bacterium]|nr:hypothetical protein [Tepidisphaeraceae bacterium]
HPTPPPRGNPAKSRAPAPPTPYIATFYDNVNITQGQEMLLIGDRMDVDFTTRQDQSTSTGPTTQGATRPATRAAAGRDATMDKTATAAPAPIGAASATQIAARGPATQPSSRPSSTQPANPPVVIRWTGKLVMVPPLPGTRPKVSAGDAVVELTGKPTTVRRTPAGQPDGDLIRAARVVYHTLDGSAKLFNSSAVPKVIISKLVNGQIDPRSTITTSTLDYVADGLGKKIAILTGPGHAMVPMESQGQASAASKQKPGGPDMMDAHWQKGAKAYFRPAGRGEANLSIEHVDLAGDVDVKHPQLVLTSQALSLYFEPAAPPARPSGRNNEIRDDAGGDVSPSPGTPGEGRGGDRARANSTRQPHPYQVLKQDRQSGPHPNPPPAYRERGQDEAAAPTTRPARHKDNDTQAELKRVIAHDRVHCQLADEKGKKQTIDCTDLDLRTARTSEGKIFARHVNAQGTVHAYDGEQDLRAQIVDLTLKPAIPATKPATDAKAVDAAKPPAARLASDTAPSQARPAIRPADTGSDSAAVELEAMEAHQQVIVTNKEGSIATGDDLFVTTEDGESHVRLSAAAGAKVIDVKKNTVTGPLITMEPKRGIAHVVGSGTMHVLQEQANGEKPRPMDVAWTRRADMNGPADRIDILGDIALKSTDADGTVNTANGDRARIDLVKKALPATRPATMQSATGGGQSAGPAGNARANGAAGNPRLASASTAARHPATAPAATRPAKSDSMADSMQMDVMKDKDVKTITIYSAGNSKVVSTLPGADGKILRRFALLGPTIIYNVQGTPASPGKSLLVPSAGQMLVSDHRPPAPKPPADPKAPRKGDDANDESDSRGDSAFQWNDHMLYSEANHNAVMVGSVKIIHQGDDTKDAKPDPVQINGDVVTAWFEPDKRPTTPPAGAPKPPLVKPAPNAAAKPGEPTAAMQLKLLTAKGHTVVTRSGASMYADHIQYDPKTHWMKATGTPSNPARYDDPDPKRSMSANEMQWNTQTWDIKMTGPNVANPR